MGTRWTAALQRVTRPIDRRGPDLTPPFEGSEDGAVKRVDEPPEGGRVNRSGSDRVGPSSESRCGGTRRTKGRERPGPDAAGPVLSPTDPDPKGASPHDLDQPAKQASELPLGEAPGARP